MATARYRGTADVRIIEKSDWENVGVDDQGKVTWSQEEGMEQEISQAAADWLKKNDKAFLIKEEGSLQSSDDENESTNDSGESSEEPELLPAVKGRRGRG